MSHTLSQAFAKEACTFRQMSFLAKQTGIGTIIKLPLANGVAKKDARDFVVDYRDHDYAHKFVALIITPQLAPAVSL